MSHSSPHSGTSLKNKTNYIIFNSTSRPILNHQNLERRKRDMRRKVNLLIGKIKKVTGK
jgi:hypothetical protein